MPSELTLRAERADLEEIRSSFSSSTTAEQIGGSVHTKAASDAVVEKVKASHSLAVDTKASKPHPGAGVTGIFGPMGSGKTLLAVAWLKALHEQGIRIASGAAAGLKFGEEVDLNDLYTLAKNYKDAIVFLDELQSYVSKYSSTSTSAVFLTESLAALRKNGIHIVFTAQSDLQVFAALRPNVTTAWYPRKSTYKRIVPKRGKPRWGRKDKWIPIKGKYDFCKLLVHEMVGNPLTFTEPPDHLHMRHGWKTPMPRTRAFRPSYADILEASMCYDTLAELDFAARLRTNRDDLREHIGVEDKPKGKGKKKDGNSVVDRGQDPELFRRFEAAIQMDDLSSLNAGLNN